MRPYRWQKKFPHHQQNDGFARAISDKLIPSLYAARTYIEVGQLSSPEIRLGILSARSEAGKLADTDSRYAPLYSKIRVLAEEADTASRIS
ncbi:MAG: hypothetical protein Ct9H300mP19_12630 [Dehalococcoidia bacterium]|nr:MAG: hypothetical protein Ct9H300mP19_12630 [Dehalococcoidia bacterium]